MPPSKTRAALVISPLQSEEDARACARLMAPLDARRLYERVGYKVVGELTDYIVRVYSELLLRKTLGPLTGFGSGMAHPPARS